MPITPPTPPTQPMLPLPPGPRRVESGGYPGYPAEDLTLEGFWAILRRHRLLISLCVIVTVGLVGAYSVLSAPTYDAKAVLQFEPEKVNVPTLLQELSSENEISTEIEVLQGRSAAVAVIDSLGLRARVKAPRIAPATGVLGRLGLGQRPRVSQLFSLLRVAPGADTVTLRARAGAGGVFTVWSLAPGAKPVSVMIGDTAEVSGVRLALRPAARGAEELSIQVVSLDDAVRSFESSLKVSRPARDADLIAVRIRSSDPVLAASEANLLAQQLIVGRQGIRMASTSSTVRFLKQQLDTLGIQLHAAEDALRAYRERAGVVDAQEQERTQVGRLAQVEAERGSIDAERQALAALLRQMRTDSARASAAGEAPSFKLISFPTLFKNQAASELLGALAQVQNERSALLTRRTPNDPDVQVLTNRIHELDTQLRGIAQTYLQGLTNQVASLEDVADRFGATLYSLPAREVQAARLQREVQVRQDLYTLLQTRLKEAEITRAMVDPTVHVVDPAAVPDRPARPNKPLNFALALVLGSLLGVGGSLARELTDRSVRSRNDAFLAAGLPIVGAIPTVRHRVEALPTTAWRLLPPPREQGRRRRRTSLGTESNGKGRSEMSRRGRAMVTLPEAPAAYAEAFSLLHANLVLNFRDHPLKTLVFTSPLPGEGKTLTAVNFSLSLAARKIHVLLIDGDLRCGLVNEVFGCPRKPGFADLLTGWVDFEEAVQSVAVGEDGTLEVLPSGALLTTPGRLMAIERVREVLAELAPKFDLVVIDSPPVNLLADAALLGSAADAVLLVARAGHTRMEALRHATDQLTAAGAPVVGTLLNDIDPRQHSAYDGTYRYLSEVERYYSAQVGPNGGRG
jgi:succinoglycan biosynthesis transport protein ExoP